MKRWLIALIAFIVGGALGVFVGATPLYLLINMAGGPYRVVAEDLELRAQALIVPTTSRARTREEIAAFQLALAATAETSAAATFCELPEELKARVIKAAERIRSASPAIQFSGKGSNAARDYLSRVSPTGPCERFIPPGVVVATAN